MEWMRSTLQACIVSKVINLMNLDVPAPDKARSEVLVEVVHGEDQSYVAVRIGEVMETSDRLDANDRVNVERTKRELTNQLVDRLARLADNNPWHLPRID